MSGNHIKIPEFPKCPIKFSVNAKCVISVFKWSLLTDNYSSVMYSEIGR